MADLQFVQPVETSRMHRVELPEEDGEAVQLRERTSLLVRDYFGDSHVNQPGPQAFLVEAPGGTVSGAHFHPIDQFQIFFPSAGVWYRKQDVSNVMVHYADAYMTYGPFGTRSQEPLHFYTLRAASTVITAFIPKDRKELIRRGRRNYSVMLDDSVVCDLPSVGDSVISTLIAPEPDGLAAYLVSAGRSAQVDTIFDLPPESVGQYYCVLEGSVWAQRRQFTARALGWNGPDGPAPSLTADEHAGCRLLVLQMPHPTAPRHPGEESAATVVS